MTVGLEVPGERTETEEHTREGRGCCSLCLGCVKFRGPAEHPNGVVLSMLVLSGDLSGETAILQSVRTDINKQGRACDRCMGGIT